VCDNRLRNLCKKGEDCEFLHKYNLKKMPVCFFFSKYGMLGRERERVGAYTST
jgi:cleavage and polyadenylation specificity factor subunit 4